MRVVMIGAGYVGLVSGACLSDFGHSVVCVDRDPERIARLSRCETPIYEPGLDALMARNVAAGLLSFTTDLPAALAGAEVVFIAVGTPSASNGREADLSQVHAAAEEVARTLTAPAVIALKSTVPVGTNRAVLTRLRALRPDLALDVASNPEFLREGAAIGDFMRPDRVVVGAETEAARTAMRRLYAPLSLRETPMIVTSLESAELIKYAANAFLATKITFINEIADLCERVGGDVQEVARGMGLDRRIGANFLHPGPGFGGSCFPKDTRALAHTGQDHGAPQRIVETVVAVNEARKQAMARRILDRLGAEGGADGAARRVTLFGVTFKPDTDDMREAPSLTIAPALIAAGVAVTACDPEGQREGAALLPGLRWVSDPYEAAAGADAIVVLTEWNLFRGLDLRRLRAAMRGAHLIDLRNVYRAAEAQAAGFSYDPVGRQPVA